ncbi:MAG: ornithine carbamoyltransferase [Alphaproteobacteria bacterium]|nr:ornithine carbamoyltransferase [Alphaproteobacteria bacterium]MBV8548413.1 ornithine carbamoyltransferase [Alphaproteobacteria bacterium]
MTLAFPAAPTVSRDFIDLDRLTRDDVRTILSLAVAMKKDPKAHQPMAGRVLALIFEKPSTRTRVSFHVGMQQLGGEVITLSGAEMQLGHGETIADTGRVMSRFVDIMMLRTFSEHKLHELAEGASVPVINGLTNQSHPCQVMADLMTIEEKLGNITGKKIVWVGDGDNNVLTSWIHAACLFDLELCVVAPPEFTVPSALLIDAQRKGAKLRALADIEVVKGADVVITDCWVSMHNSDAAARMDKLQPYQVNEKLMRLAAPHALFMHCLPAHRGEEVTDGVIDSPQSAVWDEAENRMHAQKAIICWCLGLIPQ